MFLRVSLKDNSSLAHPYILALREKGIFDESGRKRGDLRRYVRVWAPEEGDSR